MKNHRPFEAVPYDALPCDDQPAIPCDEQSLAVQTCQLLPHELMGIADIYEIMGDFHQAAQTWDRIISLLRDEWGMTEETELKKAESEKARLLAKG